MRRLWIVPVLIAGCASIAGFEDLSGNCPPDRPNCTDTRGGNSGTAGGEGAAGAKGSDGAIGASGSAGSGAAGNAGTAGSSGAGPGGSAGTDAGACAARPPGPVTGGPEMAPMRRAGGCYWIDRTEVTEAQYAEYLEANPTPVIDAKCSATPNVDPQCAARAPADAGSELPVTCVDWCDAAAFCKWAGKELCRDHFTAVSPEVLNQSDFVFACMEGRTDPAPYAPNCGEQACNVRAAAPIDAGSTSTCWVHAADQTRIHDLIGNVEEWTRSCQSDAPNADCTVRGGSFARFDAPSCCAQKTQLFRRRRIPTLGFRCCAYPP